MRRNIAQMRIGWVAALAALTLLTSGSAWAAPIVIADPDGSNAVLADDPALPSDDPMGSQGFETPTAQAAGGLSVPGAIDRLRKRGDITKKQASSYKKDWSTSVRATKRMSRARRAELNAVLANTRAMAASKQLTASRVPAVMLTVVRNRDWWMKGPSLRAGGRTRFRGSQLVWQYYAGQGLQIQWLGTFGRANALWSFGGKDDELDELLTEARALAASRAGGIAYEYLFKFGSGKPPWVSGLTQGTALTAFSRGALRLKESDYFNDARAALGIFERKPPAGVRVTTGAGVHYLQYSYAPAQRVGNGFVQALNGLHDFALFANNDKAWNLFASGEKNLRRELPRFDTGAWTLYQRTASGSKTVPGNESTLDYHKLFAQFLTGLCSRLTDDQKRIGAKAAQTSGGASPGSTPTPSTSEPDRSDVAGRTSPTRYCDASTRFKSYLRQKPTLKITKRTLTQRKRGTVVVKVDKVSFVTLAVSQGSRTLASESRQMSYGTHRLRVSPTGRSRVKVLVTATDLAGNRTSKTMQLRVRARAG